MTKDHITPVSKGGKDNLENLRTMCTCCNELRADKEHINPIESTV